MSIYSKYNVVKEDSSFDDDSTCLGLLESMNYLTEGVKIPKELRIADPAVFNNASKFKASVEKIIKHLEENDAKEKDFNKNIKSLYYGVLGNTFGFDPNGKYSSVLPVAITYIAKYCDDKAKASIKKDMEKTITAFEKMEAANKPFSDKQKGWYADIKKCVKKL